MRLDIYSKLTSNLFAENKLLKFGLVMMMLFSVFNYLTLEKALKSTTTIIQPVGATGNIWVTSDDASSDYVRFMTRYITSMLGNYTASTVDQQFSELRTLFAPEKFSEIDAVLNILKKRIKKYPSITSTVTWRGKEPLRLDKLQHVIQVDITKNRLVSGDVTKQTPVTLNIKYRIQNGRFWIVNISESTKGK